MNLWKLKLRESSPLGKCHTSSAGKLAKYVLLEITSYYVLFSESIKLICNEICRFNLRKWWCQCFTAGISQIVVGFRDDDGVVEEVKTYPVDQLPKMGAVRNLKFVYFMFVQLKVYKLII